MNLPLLATLLVLKLRADYFVGSSTLPLSQNCSIREFPCNSLETALKFVESKSEENPTIHVLGSQRLPQPVSVLSDLTIAGDTERFSGDLEDLETITLSGQSLPLANYSLHINASVKISMICFSVSLFGDILKSHPIIKVDSDGELELSAVGIYRSSSSDYKTNKPVIDATAGKLTLEYVSMSGFTLFDAPLLDVSTVDGAFSMKSYPLPCPMSASEEPPLVYHACEFSHITRIGGNGTVFSITLNESAKISLTNANFSNCVLEHNGSINGFGGAIFIECNSTSASYQLEYLSFSYNTAPTNGHNIYIRQPTAPTDKPMLRSLFEFNSETDAVSEYLDHYYVIESDNTSPATVQNFYELYDHVFVGQKYYYGSSSATGQYYEPYDSLSYIPSTATLVYVIASESFTALNRAFTVSPSSLTIRSVAESTDTPPKLGFYFSSSLSADTPLITVPQSKSLTCFNLQFELNSGYQSDSDNSYYFRCVFISVKGSLNLTDVSVYPYYSYSNPRLFSASLIDASGSSSLVMNTVSFQDFTMTSQPVLLLNPAGTLTTTKVSFSSITRETGNGAIISQEVTNSAHTLSLSGMKFSSVTCEKGNGGAVYLKITAGTVNIGTDDDVEFSECKAYPSANDGPNGGGSMYIEISGGKLNIGGTAAVKEEPSSFCSDYYVPSVKMTNGYASTIGNNLFLQITGDTPTITFGEVSFQQTSSSSAAAYLYVYTTVAKFFEYSTWYALLGTHEDFNSEFFYATYHNTSDASDQSYQLYRLMYVSTDSITINPGAPSDGETADSYGCYTDGCPSLTAAAKKLQGDSSITATAVAVTVQNYQSYEAATTALTFSKIPYLYFMPSDAYSSEPKILIQSISASGSSASALITVGASNTAVMVMIESIIFNKTDDLPSQASESRLNNTLFKVLGGSTLQLSSVTIYGFSDPCQTYLIDSSAGTLILEKTEIRSWYSSIQALLNVGTGDQFQLTESTFSNNRAIETACIMSKTLTSGDLILIQSSTFSSCSSQLASPFSFTVPEGANVTVSGATFMSCYAYNASGGVMGFTVTGGVVLINKATFSSCYCENAKGGALAFSISAGTVTVGPTLSSTSETPVTFSSCYANSTSSPTLVEGGAIYVKISGGTFCLGGESPTVDSPARISKQTKFTNCHTDGNGNGGAISLDITGGTVLLGVDTPVRFSECSATRNISTSSSYSAKSIEQTGGFGGALCISLSKGTLQLGGIYQEHYPYTEQDPTSTDYRCDGECDYSTGNGHLYFDECSTTSSGGLSNSGGFGGAYYLRLLDSDASITYGRQTFSRSYSTDNITGQGTFVYFSTNVTDYITTPERFVDLLGHSYDAWYKLDAFLAFDETTKTRYQMYAIGNTSLYLDDDSTRSWYCGVVDGCPTVEAALLNWDRFVIPPQYILIDDTYEVEKTSIIARDVTVQGSNEENRDTVRVYSVREGSAPRSVFSILANVTFQHLAFDFQPSTSLGWTFFGCEQNGSLTLNNTLFYCSSGYLYMPLVVVEEGGALHLNNTVFANMYTNNLMVISPKEGSFTLNNTVLITTAFAAQPILEYELNDSSHKVNVHDLIVSGFNRNTRSSDTNDGYPAITADLTAGSLTVSKCTFEHCHSDTFSAAVCVFQNGGSTSITHCTFYNCTAAEDGGALYILLDSGDITISSCSFTNCGTYSDSYTTYSTTITHGGAIWTNITSGSFSLSSTSFLNCTATGNGGAVSLEISKGSLTIGKGVSISNCSAGFSDPILATHLSNGHAPTTNGDVETRLKSSGHGGGIFMKIATEHPEDIKLKFSEISYKNNSAEDQGATIFVITNKDEILDDGAWSKLVPKEKDTTEGQFEYSVATNMNTPETYAPYKTDSLPEKVHHGLSAGAIAGIVIGSIVGLILIVGLIILLIFCIKKRSSSSSSSSSSRTVSVEDPPEDNAQPEKKDDTPADGSMTTAPDESPAHGGDVPMQNLSQ